MNLVRPKKRLKCATPVVVVEKGTATRRFDSIKSAAKELGMSAMNLCWSLHFLPEAAIYDRPDRPPGYKHGGVPGRLGPAQPKVTKVAGAACRGRLGRSGDDGCAGCNGRAGCPIWKAHQTSKELRNDTTTHS